MHWTIDTPTQPGKYMIRPLPFEKLVLGFNEFTQVQEVELAFVPGMAPNGLCFVLGFSAVEVRGTHMEYYGPLPMPTN
jgi:hypothetical protein